MNSWRDSTSQVVQDDFDNLFNAVLPFAVQTLEHRGALYPFGAIVAEDSEIRLRGADPGDGERPNSTDVLSLLYDSVRLEKTGLRAAAYVADVLVEGSDAIRVDLEHSEGVAITIIVPYTRSRFKGTLKLADMRVQVGELRAWADI